MAEVLAEPEISEFIKEFLDPIPGDSPAGQDASNDEEYFKLNMEFPKTVPDYKNWIELSDLILKEKSKDIKVASWLCFALYRTEQMKGLRNGLELVYHLLKKFGNDLYPKNNSHRSKAIQFLSTSRVTKLLEKDEINKSNANEILRINEVINLIVSECEKLMPENIPVLQSLQDTISGHLKEADKAVKPSPVPEQRPAPPPTAEKKVQAATPVKREEQPVIKSPRSASEDEIIIQLRRTLTYFYEILSENETTERVPESFFAFGIARQLQWSSLVLPSSEEKITNIEPPNEIIRKLLFTWHNENKSDVLIPRIELEYLKDNSEFRYWFDAQKYLVNALESKGGSYSTAANDIKYYLSRLIKRLPELPKLKFASGEVPFADKDTLKWLDQISLTAASGPTGGDQVSSAAPVIVDQSYDDINLEYEEAVRDLPKNFEQNLQSMHQRISAEERSKGKFLRRLNIARFCYEAKQYNAAKVNLEELNRIIEGLSLSEWEPALCTAVWQSLFLTNVQLLFNADNEAGKSILEKQQEELYYKIAKYNAVLAINLEQQKHKRRK